MEFTDRYEALGIPCPDLETVCKGQCEGTGFVPLHISEEEKDWKKLWEKQHVEAHSCKGILKACKSFLPEHPWWAVRHLWEGWKCDGWHFVKCPDCGGTGKIDKERKNDRS